MDLFTKIPMVICLIIWIIFLQFIASEIQNIQECDAVAKMSKIDENARFIYKSGQGCFLYTEKKVNIKMTDIKLK